MSAKVIALKLKNRRKTLFVCCIVAAVLSQANAQVSKTNFKNGIDALNAAIAKRDTAGKFTALIQIEQMMSTQIMYRISIKKPMQRTYLLDSLQADADSKEAESHYKTESTEPPGAGKTADMQTADKFKAMEKIDKAKALNELSAIRHNSESITTEEELSTSLARLKGAGGKVAIGVNQAKIDDNLNQFEATID